MQLCGCLPVNIHKEKRKQQPAKKLSLKRDLQSNNNGAPAGVKMRTERTKSSTSTVTESSTKRYTLKKHISSTSVNKVIFLDNYRSQTDISERRSNVNTTESENEQRKFLKLNKQKRRSIHELQFNHTVFSDHKRTKSSPDVNQFTAANASYETTTCDEIDNPDHSRHKRSARRRKRSKSPRKQMPSEILDAIKFELIEPVGLNENQLKDIPYENIKTTSQPFRISLSPHSARRRRSSPFNRAGDVVHNASNNMLSYRPQPAVVCVAQVKSTKIINITRTTENCMMN